MEPETSAMEPETSVMEARTSTDVETINTDAETSTDAEACKSESETSVIEAETSNTEASCGEAMVCDGDGACARTYSQTSTLPRSSRSRKATNRFTIEHAPKRRKISNNKRDVGAEINIPEVVAEINVPEVVARINKVATTFVSPKSDENDSDSDDSDENGFGNWGALGNFLDRITKDKECGPKIRPLLKEFVMTI